MIIIFIGRKKELEILNKLHSKDKFEMIVMYGRRRIGKTTLISEFIKDKNAIFYTAQEANDKINLENFSNKIYNNFDLPKSMGSFKTWNDAFEFIGEKAKNQRIILAFDEFPYAANENKSLKSILQNSIDHILKDTKLFLILCGSQITFMEEEILGAKSPLFGRRTAQIKLEGFNYLESAKLLEGFSNEEIIKYYACIGGTPQYLLKVDKDLSFEENIKELYFDISSYLYNEPVMLLQQELREPAMYNSIISTVASGATKLNEISTKLEEDRAKVYKYLDTLINMEIITKEYPFGENIAKSRKGIYKIADNCYAFWYKFVFPNKPEIESGTGSIVADSEVFGENLNRFIGKPAFEDICRQYLIEQNLYGNLPFKATSYGRWWGNDTKEKRETDFDIVIANRKEKKMILCECKFRNTLNNLTEIKKLVEKDYMFPEYIDKYYYFFSKINFSKDAIDFVKNRKNIKLITLDDLF